MLVTPLLLLQAISATANAEPPRQVRLEPVDAVKNAGADTPPVIKARHCTDSKSWCLTFKEKSDAGADGPTIIVEHRGQFAKAPPLPAEYVAFGSSINFWDSPVEYQTSAGKPGLIFGTISYQSEGYSGGGAQSSSMMLYAAEKRADGKLHIDLLEDPIPYAQSALIRACFSENDMKLRRDMCHDDYTQDVTIKPTGNVINGLPELLYISKASISPGFARRDQDNSDADLLKTLVDKDFEPRIDDRCTYTTNMYVHKDRDRYVLDFKDCSEFGTIME